MLQVQGNVFKGTTGEVALTAAGGLRQLPGLSETFENAALVKILDFSVFLVNIYLKYYLPNENFIKLSTDKN